MQAFQNQDREFMSIKLNRDIAFWSISSCTFELSQPQLSSKMSLNSFSSSKILLNRLTRALWFYLGESRHPNSLDTRELVLNKLLLNRTQPSIKMQRSDKRPLSVKKGKKQYSHW